MERTTWDGLPVSEEKPFGAAVVVWRERDGELEFLVLHRLAPGGPEYEGEWAWTPPTGARFPGEPLEETARRELLEETGLELELEPTDLGTEEWAVFVARARTDAQVVLDAEHDRFEWLPAAEAAKRCLPAAVGTQIERVAARLGTER